MNIPRPAFVVPCMVSYLELYSYFTIPFPPPADIWPQLEWVEKFFVSG